MVKEISFDRDVREKLCFGVDVFVNVVKVILGFKGCNVVI